MLTITIKPISFIDFDKKKVLIPAFTEVFVDVQEGIAFAMGYHFDIDKTEYSSVNS